MRLCTLCSWRLPGKKFHGFVSDDAAVTCGRCPEPWYEPSLDGTRAVNEDATDEA